MNIFDCLSAAHVRREIRKTISFAWDTTDPIIKQKQNELFPNGKPEPEEFIKVVTAHLKNIQTSKQEAP